MKPAKGLGILLASALLLGGCGPSGEEPLPSASPEVEQYQENAEAKPVEDGELTLGLYSVDSLNPLTTKNRANADVLSLMYDGLFRMGTDLSPTYCLCANHTVSEDGRTYRFYLRSDVRFHDGSALTLEDARDAVLLAQESDVYGPRLENVESCQIRGDALQITLKQPDANFPAMLDFPIVKRSGDRRPSTGSGEGDAKSLLETAPSGTGMFRLESYRIRKELKLVRNDGWALGARPYLLSIRVRLLPDQQTMIYAFENGEIDMLSSDVIRLSEYAPKRDLTVKDIETQQLTFLGVNASRPFFGAMTRKALSLLADRNRIVSAAFAGRAYPTDLPVHTSSFLYTKPDGETYDVYRAQTYLLADGWSDDDQNGTLDRMVDTERSSFRMEILVNEENGNRVRCAEILQESFRLAGIEASVKAVDFERYESLIASGSYDTYIGEINLQPSQNLRPLLDGGLVAYRDDALTERLDMIDGSGGGDMLAAAHADMNSYLRENNPIVPLCFAAGALMFDERLGGNINPICTNAFAGMQNWYVTGE